MNKHVFSAAIEYLDNHNILIHPDLLDRLGAIGAIKTVNYYTKVLKELMRQLSDGEITEEEFLELHRGYVDRQFRRAWNTAMRENGLEPRNDMTVEMEEILAGLVFAEIIYMERLAGDIKKKEQELDVYLNRASLWALTYLAVVNQALTKTGTRELFIWQLGPTEHCNTCLDRSGRIKTGAEWQADVLPQSRALDCGGWRCQCALVRTETPASEMLFVLTVNR